MPEQDFYSIIDSMVGAEIVGVEHDESEGALVVFTADGRKISLGVTGHASVGSVVEECIGGVA